MKPKTISIIGGTGVMGQTFAKLFEKEGYEVIIASRKTNIACEEAAAKGDVVIVSVPIDCTVEVIKQIGKHVREGALFTDFTSVKVKPIEAMLKYSKAEVIGGHPVFGPMKSINKQNFVLCHARGENYMDWYKDFLDKMGANVIVTTADEHDKAMGVIQCLRHFSTIAMGNTLRKMHFDLEESKKYMSPIYEIRMDMVGRLFDEDGGLYADITMMNPYGKKIITEFLKESERVLKSIKAKDKDKFVKEFDDTTKFLGDFTKEGMEKTNYLIEKLVKWKG